MAPLPPFVVERVSDRVFRFRQPQDATEWQQVRDALGKGAHIAKLNALDEGPDGFSDDYASTLGLIVHDLAIEPRGDGPILSQIEGVFIEPSAVMVLQADALVCDPSKVVGVHCTHGFDRTGYEVARERVLCEGWDPARAHDEWHRKAQYIPHGVRVPSPGLEESWRKFVGSLGADAPPSTS